jgi:hypothetical protein
MPRTRTKSLMTDATRMSAISRLFSPGVFREMATRGRSSLFARLAHQAALPAPKKATVGDAFDVAFALLRQSGVRNEYVYRAALTHNVLLGTHSLKTASMLTEFRVGTSKADLAILNGTGTVYEIKSDRDSLTRLASQVTNYRKVFAKIYVIAGNAHVDDIMARMPHDVGVMALERWDRIRTVRDAADRPDLVCPVTICQSLRTAEARALLRNLNVAVPEVPNTLMHGALKECFARLDPAQAHAEMVKTLKKSRNLEPLSALVDSLPESLQPAALSVQIRRVDHVRLLSAIETPLHIALGWA